MRLSAGARLGPYEILAPLGVGGMGEVYRARDTRLDRTVAIKVLPADAVADAPRRERFRREARAISSLAHPHICALHDVGDENGVDFLVMEYLRGDTLAHRLRKGPILLEEAVRIAGQLADALHAAHDAGLIHRDLKPANVILTSAGAKVLDFGLAKWLDSEHDSAILSADKTARSTLTHVGSVLGTVQYMAPEQIEGQSIDARADLFALGTVIYEMVTGVKAFEGASTSSVMAAILTSTPPSLAQVQPLAPPILDRLVRKCLAKDRAKRWQTAVDLRDELAWIEHDLRESGEQAAPAAGAGSWWRRAGWAGAAAIAVAALLVWRPTASGPTIPVYATIEAPADSVLGEDDRQAPLPTRTPMVFTPDGRSLILQAARGGKPQLFLRSLDQPGARPIAGTDDARVPFVSPDGKWVGFWAGNELRKVPIEGGPPTTICRLEALLGPNGASWGARDVIVFGDDASGRIMRVSAGGGIPAAVTAQAPYESQHVTPSFLPDGSHFLFSEVSTLDATQTRLMVQGLEETAARLVIPSATDGRVLPSGRLAFMRLGTLMTVAFDSVRAKVTGDPVATVGGVMQSGLRARAGANNTGAGMFSVSSLGALVVIRGPVTGGEANQLISVTADGHAASAEPTSGAPAGNRLYVRVSPDRSRAVVSVITPLHHELWVADWTRNVWTLCRDCRGDFSIPSLWSADGRRLLIGGWETLVAHALDNSTSDEVMVREANHMLMPAAWRADGRLVYTSSLLPSSDVEIKQVDEGQSTGSVIVPFGLGDEPDVSPDGRWLAYTLAPIGEGNVVVQPLSGPGVRTLVSTRGGRDPMWSADGRTLYYAQKRGDPEETVAFAVDVTAPAGVIVAGTPRELFHNPDPQTCTPRCYDLANRRGFLFRDPHIVTRPSVTRMDLVLNWTSTLPK